VTLNRASRVRPQRTKNVRRSWSMVLCMPIEKAQTEGATPNEIFANC
jgi:hypothetical protein